MRAKLIEEWPKKCENGITRGKKIKLEGNFLEYVMHFDFSILEGANIAKILEEHKKTKWHSARFGGGLPERPSTAPIPEKIQSSEVTYVSQLMKAYSQKEKSSLNQHTDLEKYPNLKDHFNRSRVQFYSAEALRTFTRDTLQPGEYEKLQDEFFHGIIDTVNMSYPHGYERILNTCKQAMSLAIGHPIQSRMNTLDRGGICHQLVNDEKMKWVDND